ncbi:MAG: hypothetical protein ABMB14_08285 [Myxococcota bacterium]
MSMWLNYAKVSASTLKSLRAKPETVEPLFFDSALPKPGDFDPDADVFGEDYRTISEVVEAMVEAEAGGEWLARAMGEGSGDEVGYEFCYGAAFAFAPAEVAEIAAEGKKDPDPFGIGEFFAQAAAEGKGIIGGVS